MKRNKHISFSLIFLILIFPFFQYFMRKKNSVPLFFLNLNGKIRTLNKKITFTKPFSIFFFLFLKIILHPFNGVYFNSLN